MLPWVCSVIDHRRRQNVVITSVTHSAIASCATFLFLPHFDVICDLLLNRRTATWNLFVNLNNWGLIISSCCFDEDGRSVQECVPHVQLDRFFFLLTNNITAFWRYRCHSRCRLNSLFSCVLVKKTLKNAN